MTASSSQPAAPPLPPPLFANRCLLPLLPPAQRGSGIRARPAVLGDPELVEVLELATDEELRGLYELLHGGLRWARQRGCGTA